MPAPLKRTNLDRIIKKLGVLYKISSEKCLLKKKDENYFKASFV